MNVDVDEATSALQDIQGSLPDAGKRSVRQLTVLAEGAMKEEVPEGSGRDVHTRDTIETEFDRGGLRGTVRPTKKTNSGIPMADIITGDPSWTWDDPPPIPPLFDWVQAKWGATEVGAAFALQWHLVENGVETFPNPFVDRSIRKWEDQVEAVAGRAVRDELGVD